MRFLHVADIHLGLRITRFDESACNRIGEARFAAIENLRAAAVEHRVDFVLVAGDLFDDHSVSHTVSERVFALFEGRAMPCPVYLIPGNHDPLVPGGVWDREPWTRDQTTKNIHLLRVPTPVTIPDLPVTIFPCPLRQRHSIDDPTAWIANHPRNPTDRAIRIGLAHGSLRIMPNLPEDDHLIRKDAADHYGLDYLALGHWHKPSRWKSRDGVERTAYSGVHEPMGFPGVAAPATGWSAYSTDSEGDRFQDEGRGTALLVSIDEPCTPPRIEALEIGKLRWVVEHRDVTLHSIGEIVSEFGADRRDQEVTLLRLSLSGVLDPEQYARIDSQLREIIVNRYCPGSSLNANQVLVEPNAEQLKKIAGEGVLSRMVVQLREESHSADATRKRIADHALKLLYRIAWEEQSQ